MWLQKPDANLRVYYPRLALFTRLRLAMASVLAYSDIVLTLLAEAVMDLASQVVYVRDNATSHGYSMPPSSLQCI